MQNIMPPEEILARIASYLSTEELLKIALVNRETARKLYSHILNNQSIEHHSVTEEIMKTDSLIGETNDAEFIFS